MTILEREIKKYYRNLQKHDNASKQLGQDTNIHNPYTKIIIDMRKNLQTYIDTFYAYQDIYYKENKNKIVMNFNPLKQLVKSIMIINKQEVESYKSAFAISGSTESLNWDDNYQTIQLEGDYLIEHDVNNENDGNNYDSDGNNYDSIDFTLPEPTKFDSLEPISYESGSGNYTADWVKNQDFKRYYTL